MANKIITAATISSISTDSGSSSTDFVTNDQTLTLAGTANVSAGTGSATLGIWLTGGTFGAGTLVGSISEGTPGNGINWSFDFTTSGVANAQSLAAGTYSIVVTDGNVSIASPVASQSVTVDFTAPAAPIFDGLGSLNPGGSMNLTGTAEANALVTLYDGASNIGATSANSGGTWNFTTASLSNSTHVFTATATDAAGNVGVPSASDQVGSTAPETLTGGAGNDVLSSGVESDWAGEAYRLYQVALGREPDSGGFDYWVTLLRGGMSVETAAGGFTSSPEFQSTYGSLDDTQFVTLLYNNALHRAPDPGGLSYWLNLLSTGTSRDSVVAGFSESPEDKAQREGASRELDSQCRSV